MKDHKIYANFDQLFEQLYTKCSIDNGASSDLMPAIKDNCYFDALRSVLEEEKQKIEMITSEICGNNALLNSQETNNDLESIGFSAVEQTLAECRELCQNVEENDAEICAKMQECLQDYEQASEMIDQNTNLCAWRATELLAVHAQLRPVHAADVQQFEHAVIRHSAHCGKMELRDAVCAQLLLLKANGGGQKKKRKNFPRDTIQILNDYFMNHIDQPYPDDSVKLELAERCGITLAQVSNWFGNKRIRFRKNQLKSAAIGAKKCRSKNN